MLNLRSRHPSGELGRTGRLAAIVTVVVATVLLSACGSKTGDTEAAAGAIADTAGSSVKVGLLNSLSGTMAISEVTVRDSIKLAIEEINAGGGVLGAGGEGAQSAVRAALSV